MDGEESGRMKGVCVEVWRCDNFFLVKGVWDWGSWCWDWGLGIGFWVSFCGCEGCVYSGLLCG